jgi:Baseplate J-like protein
MNETCGCCEGTEQLTPIVIVNRPGLDALVYRAGTQASFLETMIARLSNLGIPMSDLDIPLDESIDKDKLIYPLRGLTARSENDASIAFLDAWATVADVLTFYQERIANEGYLHTATERRSILELGKLVGYVLRPGVSASVYLAYTLEKDHDVTIPPGNRAQSVPGPGELPQSFETAEQLEARFIWNTLQTRLTRPQYITLIPGSGSFDSPPSPPDEEIGTINTDTVYFQGTATKLKPNDALLFIFNDPTQASAMTFSEPGKAFAFVKVTSVEAQAAQNRTKVQVSSGQQTQSMEKMLVTSLLSSPEGPTSGATLSFTNLVKTLKEPPSLPPRNSQRLERRVSQIFDPQSGIHAQMLKAINPALAGTLDAALSNADVTPTSPSALTLDCPAALRVKAAMFGHDLPNPPESPPIGSPRVAFLEAQRNELAYLLYLDAVYDQIAAGSWVVVETYSNTFLQPDRTVHKVVNAQTITQSLADFLQIADPSLLQTYKQGESRDLLAMLFVARKITLLTLDTPWLPRRETPTDVLFFLRSLSIYAQSECLTLSEVPNTSTSTMQVTSQVSTNKEEPCTIGGDTIELDKLYPDLKSGRWAIVSGERADVEGTSGVVVSELVMLAGVTQDVQKLPDGSGLLLPGDKLHTFLKLAAPLSYTYKCDTVTIYGNVVRANHGETRTETLGSGAGSQSLQRFTLSQSPLTYLAAPTAVGAASTLQVRVNNILWHEIDSLVEAGPIDRDFITETDDAGKTAVVFGNGQHGARLPTGVENVKAVYRTGIGQPGNVKAGQITLLATKPVGVKSVVNPLRASGGADRENRDSARRNIPVALMALDRLVSVQDYEDFARAYAGIGKAGARSLSDGRRQLVHLTIVGADNIPIDTNSDLYQNLVQALHQLGDPNLPLKVEIAEVMFIVISAGVRLLPDYALEFVEPNIRAALQAAFGFDNRELGQPVYESEVLSVIQGVAGVDYVNLEILAGVDEDKIVSALDAIQQNPSNPDPDDPNEANEKDESETAEFLELLGLTGHANIPVSLAHIDKDKNILPAQLAFLSPDVPDTLILTELPQ